MTAPGGTPGLPSGTVLTLDNMESKLQDMSPSAMKGRAVEWFPDMAKNTTGGNPLSVLSPFGFLTDVWARFNATIANANPAAVNSVDDLGPLFTEFVENLPIIGQFVTLVEAFLGQYDGTDPALLAIQNLFGTIPKLIGGLLSGFQIPGLDASKIISGTFLDGLIPGLNVSKIVSGIFSGSFIPSLDASKIISGEFLTNLIPGLDVSKIISGVFGGGFIPGLDASKITSGTFAQSFITGLPAALSGIVSNVSSVIDSIVEQWGGGSGGGAPAVPAVASVGAVLGNANRTTVAIPVPAGIAKDDVVVVVVDNTSAVPTPMTPAPDFVLAPHTGYQTVDQSTQLRVYWKRCTGADVGTYDFTFDTANYCKAVAIRCTGVATTGNPIDTDVFAGGNANTLAGLSLTTTGANALLIWAADSWGSQVLTPPAGFTSKVAYSSSGGLAVGSAIQAAAGATGAKTGTISGYSGHCLWMGALKAGTEPVHHTIPDLVGVLNAIPGAKLIGSVASSLLSGILGGGLIPGLDASKIVSGIFHQSMVNITNIASGIVSGIFGAGQIPALDASKITSGTFAQSQVAGLPAGLSDLGAGIQGAVNGIVNSLQGAAGAFWTQADANAALSSQAAATAAAAAALAQIQAGQNNNNNGGLNAIVDFSTFPDSTNLPSIFTQTYIGGSALPAGAFGVVDGKAGTVNNEGPFAIKTIIGEYNVNDTVTDYQRISAVWANAPGYSYQNPTPFFTPAPWFGAYRADNTILARYKDVNNWTQFRFLSANQLNPGVCILETCVNGVVTELTRVSHGFRPSTNYVFDAGTPSSLMQFRVICGAKVIMAYTDSAAVSQVGPLFRSAAKGGTEYGAQVAGVPANPARMLYFAVQDNSPAGVVGSGARFYRGLTAGVAGSANAVIPNNTLNETEYRTSDYTWAPASNCRVTVAKTDWYIVSARVAYSAASGAAVRLYRNGVTARTSSGSNSIFGNVITSVMYLQAGDYVQIGLTAGATIVGSADGADTYLEITRVGKAT